jgi:hypothetical protein
LNCAKYQLVSFSPKRDPTFLARRDRVLRNTRGTLAILAIK